MSEFEKPLAEEIAATSTIDDLIELAEKKGLKTSRGTEIDFPGLKYQLIMNMESIRVNGLKKGEDELEARTLYICSVAPRADGYRKKMSELVKNYLREFVAGLPSAPASSTK